MEWISEYVLMCYVCVCLTVPLESEVSGVVLGFWVTWVGWMACVRDRAVRALKVKPNHM